jgi:hypothetical protein
MAKRLNKNREFIDGRWDKHDTKDAVKNLYAVI